MATGEWWSEGCKCHSVLKPLFWNRKSLMRSENAMTNGDMEGESISTKSLVEICQITKALMRKWKKQTLNIVLIIHHNVDILNGWNKVHNNITVSSLHYNIRIIKRKLSPVWTTSLFIWLKQAKVCFIVLIYFQLYYCGLYFITYILLENLGYLQEIPTPGSYSSSGLDK